MLTEALSHKMDIFNLSLSGSDTTTALLRLRLVAKHAPVDAVILSLSLPNESFNVALFKKNISQLRQNINALPAVPIIATPYPVNNVNSAVRAMYDDVVAFIKKEFRYHIDFYTNVHDGTGSWPTGLYEDDVHPNTEGHRKMFEAIDVDAIRNIVLGEFDKRRIFAK